MKIWACCIYPAYQAVKEALGVVPFTALEVETFKPKLIEGYDLLYFRLHGLNHMPYVMFGERENKSLYPAINVEQIEQAKLDGAIVILANCYGATSPFVEAFYRAGASVVIAGIGPNYAAGNKVVGIDLFAKYVVKALKAGLSIQKAVKLAKVCLLLTIWRRADKDALAFKIMRR